MSDVVSSLLQLVSQWPSDSKVAQQRVKEIVQKFSTPGPQNRINPDEILKVHPTGGLREPEESTFGWEISFIYAPTGERTAKKLRPYLKTDLLLDLFWELPAGGEWDPKDVEHNIANSLIVVILLSKDALREPAVIFAMECALHAEYKEKVHVVLVHDAGTCFFPSGDEQPNSIKHLFAEKAVTLLDNYITVAADEIIQRLEDITGKELFKADTKDVPSLTSTAHAHTLSLLNPYPNYICNNCKNNSEGERFYCALCQYDLCAQCAESTKQSIQTDCFLSHKRTTAQVIAGRLYEGLKTNYKVFLDSEAKFKIHDLEKIVQETKLFILILSSGFLDSYWCCQEVRAALKFGRPILVVREHSYQLPPRDSLDSSFDDIKPAIYESPCIPWLAEYNSSCLHVITKKHLGPPLSVIHEAEVWFEANYEEIMAEKATSGHIPLSKWEGKVNHFIECLFSTAKESISSIEGLDISHTEIEEEEVLAFDLLPNLVSLKLNGCFFSGSSLRLIGRVVPKLKFLYIAEVPIINLMFASLVRKLEFLEQLDIANCVQLTDWSLQQLANKCKNLTALRVAGCSFTEEGVKAFSEALPNCQIIFE